ncbi:hypothetical protein ACFPFV_07260 [Salinicoccus siamensis]|uniref:Uncharacterized protein n=1 Tax=Salinicoccus siamensis TaxID=381830 RepID=A0ABV5Z7A5_9STAP
MIDRTIRLGISSLLMISTLFAINTNAVMEAEQVDEDAEGGHEAPSAEEAPGQEDMIKDTPDQEDAVQAPETPAVEPEEGLLIQTEPEQSQEEAIHKRAAEDKKEAESAPSSEEESGEIWENTPDTSEPSTGEAPPIADSIVEDAEYMIEEPESTSEEPAAPEPTGGVAENREGSTDRPKAEPSNEEESEDAGMPAAEEKGTVQSGVRDGDNAPSPKNPPQDSTRETEQYDESAPAKQNITGTASAPKFYRYDHGDILEGISLHPGAPVEELNLLDERVNKLMCSRILRAD